MGQSNNTDLAFSCPPTGMTLKLRGEKGSSLNSDSLAPKPLASSLYVPASEACCSHTRSIPVTSLFASPGNGLCGRKKVGRGPRRDSAAPRNLRRFPELVLLS